MPTVSGVAGPSTTISCRKLSLVSSATLATQSAVADAAGVWSASLSACGSGEVWEVTAPSTGLVTDLPLLYRIAVPASGGPYPIEALLVGPMSVAPSPPLALTVSGSLSVVLTSTVTAVNTTSPTDAIALAIPANSLLLGSTNEFWVIGELNNGSAGPVGYTFALNVGGVAICSPPPLVVLAGSTKAFRVQGMVTIRTVGPTGTGYAMLSAEAGASASVDPQPITAIDTTVTQALSIGVTMSAADPAASWSAQLATIRPGKSS